MKTALARVLRRLAQRIDPQPSALDTFTLKLVEHSKMPRPQLPNETPRAYGIYLANHAARNLAQHHAAYAGQIAGMGITGRL